MKDSNWTWRSVGLISIAVTVILAAGFIYAVRDILYPAGDMPLTSLPQETQETSAPEAGTAEVLKVVALGDSLAKGTGDNTGSGFVKRAIEGLSSQGATAELLGNMGINGQTTSGLQNKLKEEGVRYTLRQANVILLSIGGNDLFRGADLLQKASGSSSPEADDMELTPEALLSALPETSEKLGQILNSIAEINPSAHIYYIGLYNPFGDIQDLLVPGNHAVTAWNNAAMEIINDHKGMTLVPTFDLFNNHWEQYLSSDHFHPNGDGYQRMGDRIVQAVR